MIEIWKHFKYDTPFGQVTIHEDGLGIARMDWETMKKKPKGICEETERIKNAYEQLTEYFEGKRKSFDLLLRPRGTAFQQKVWKVLRTIPFGETRTYKEIAEAIGDPNAPRAVGMANNRNPLPIFIPCHRVLGSSGQLLSYAGGADLKKALLKFEGIEPVYKRNNS